MRWDEMGWERMAWDEMGKEYLSEKMGCNNLINNCRAINQTFKIIYLNII